LAASRRTLAMRLGPRLATLKRDGFSSNRHRALTSCWRMIFSDLPSPAEASSQMTNRATGFAQAGNRYPLFGIMR
jgi:hypothetical protein